jgi:transposase
MPRTGRPKIVLVLTDEEREQLQRWARRRKSAQALALRSRIVLACATGLSNKEVAAREKVSAPTVGKWRSRFIELRLDGLDDDPRPGRPPSITAEQVEDVVVATLESTPANATHWSRTSMAKRSGLSKSSIGRIWKAFELKPHRVDGFKVSNDPLFVDKVFDVVGLYLNPPEAAVVLSVDEKSQVQALARSQPAFPMMPGMPEKRTHDYVRHGTTSLFAAFNTADGTVISSLHRRHRTAEFKKFLVKIDQQVPDELTCTWSATTTAPTRARRSSSGWPRTRVSTSTSPRPTPPGSTRSSAGSASSPNNCSSAATTAASKPSNATSAPGSRHGTTTRGRSSGPSPPRTSSPPSDDF